MIIMPKNTEPLTIGEAMGTMSDKDLVFIAAYNPQVFKTMCNMWSLEIELEKEGKLISHHPVILNVREPENWFVSLRHKLQIWLFSNLLKMVSRKQ